jgi:hypothetical protein
MQTIDYKYLAKVIRSCTTEAHLETVVDWYCNLMKITPPACKLKKLKILRADIVRQREYIERLKSIEHKANTCKQ